jgi:hypothetical protein
MRRVPGARSAQSTIYAGVVGALALGLAAITSGVADAQSPSLRAGMPVQSHNVGRTGVVNQIPGLPGGIPNPINPGGSGAGSPPAPGGGMPQFAPEQLQVLQQLSDQDRELYITSLARNMNVDPAVLKAAMAQTDSDMKDAHIASIQQSVQSGQLTPDQGAQMIQMIQAGQMLPPTGGGLMPGMSGLPGMPGH